MVDRAARYGKSLDRIAVDMPFDGKRMIYGGFTPIVDA